MMIGRKTILLFVVGLVSAGLQEGVFAQESAIRVGDRLDLEIKGVPIEDRQEVSSLYLVNDKGTVHLPYLSIDTSAAGLTPSALAESIERAYREAQIYTNPTIVIAPQVGDASPSRVVVAASGPLSFGHDIAGGDCSQWRFYGFCQGEGGSVDSERRNFDSRPHQHFGRSGEGRSPEAWG